MKTTTALGLFVLLILTACNKDESSPGNDSLLLLEVDYLTNTFIGGKEYTYSSSVHADTVPVKACYVSPCDFGELAICFEPFKNRPAIDTIFKGEIMWQHTGAIEVPEVFCPASKFSSTTSTASNTPSNFQFQVIFIDENCHPASFSPIWNAVSDLSKAKEYYNPNKKIGIFLYTPGVGYPSDEVSRHKNEWRWFIVMYKQTV